MPRPAPLHTLDALTRSLGQIAPTWRGNRSERTATQPTGFPALDALLPGDGWPVGALTEVVPVADGIGEVRLVLPAVRQICSTQRRIVFIDPPFIPNPPALHECGLPLPLVLWIAARGGDQGMWAACQLLREACTGAVLLWNTCNRDHTLRKLQLAAETGRSLAFLFRGVHALRHASPAALRLELRPTGDGLKVHVHKTRGGRPGTATVRL